MELLHNKTVYIMELLHNKTVYVLELQHNKTVYVVGYVGCSFQVQLATQINVVSFL